MFQFQANHHKSGVNLAQTDKLSVNQIVLNVFALPVKVLTQEQINVNVTEPTSHNHKPNLLLPANHAQMEHFLTDQT